MEKNFPVFKLRIAEGDNQKSMAVDYVGLVDSPAIMTNWIAFKDKLKFVADNERQLVMGALMISDMPIFRRDEVRGEHYVIFDKEEIFKIVQKFYRNNYHQNFDLMHDPSQKVEGVYFIESMIIDETRGVFAPKGFEDLAQGSWIVTAKVDNQEVWDNYIKTGKVKGFSIEGFFEYEYEAETDQKTLEYIADIARGAN